MTGTSDLTPWLILIALGAFHGLNPAMGWLFAVALGLYRKSRRVVLVSLVPIALGHAAAIAVVVFAAVVFVMAGVLRLAVLARRDEIEIMLLVGANPGFVRGPFLVAGLAQGVVAAGLALGAVELARRAALGWAGSPLVPLELFAGRGLPPGYVLLVLATGVVVSVAAAFFAVRRSL